MPGEEIHLVTFPWANPESMGDSWWDDMSLQITGSVSVNNTCDFENANEFSQFTDPPGYVQQLLDVSNHVLGLYKPNNTYGATADIPVKPGDVINASIMARCSKFPDANYNTHPFFCINLQDKNGNSLKFTNNTDAWMPMYLTTEGTTYTQLAFNGFVVPTGLKFNGVPVDAGNIRATIYPAVAGGDITNIAYFDNEQITVTHNTPETHFEAITTSAQDFFPFGWGMLGRSYKPTDMTFGFNGKENDNEISGTGNSQDYGNRIYDPRICRFPSVDPITNKYPELTPYQFASNSPIYGIDLDGLEIFCIHGTWSNPKTFSVLQNENYKTIMNITHNNVAMTFKWSGYNTDKARRRAAKDLANFVIEQHKKTPDEPITLLGHSHGGNVAIMAANILKKKGYKVDYLITINTPVREYQVDEGAVGTHVNIYQHYDPIQANGGNTVNIPDQTKVILTPFGLPIVIPTSYEGSVKGTGEMGPADRTFKDAINIDVPFDRNNIHNTHNTPNLWKERLNDAINPPEIDFKDTKMPSIEPDKPDKTYVAPR